MEKERNKEKLARYALHVTGTARLSAETTEVGTVREVCGDAASYFSTRAYYATLLSYTETAIRRIESTRANLMGAAVLDSSERDAEEDFARVTDEGVEAATEGRRGASARLVAENSARTSAELLSLRDKLAFINDTLSNTERRITVRDCERLVRYGIQLTEPGVRTAISMAFSGKDDGIGAIYLRNGKSSVLDYLEAVNTKISGHPYVQAIRMVGKAFGTGLTDQLDGIGTGNSSLFQDITKKRIDLSTPEGLSVYSHNIARSGIPYVEADIASDAASLLLSLKKFSEEERPSINEKGLNELREKFGIEIDTDGIPSSSDDGKEFRLKMLGAEGVSFGSEAVLENSGQENVLKEYMETYRLWTDRSSSLIPSADRLVFLKDKPFGRDVECEATTLFAGSPVAATSGETIRSAVISLKSRQIYQEAYRDMTGHDDPSTEIIIRTIQEKINDFVERYGKNPELAEKEITAALLRLEPNVTEWVRESLEISDKIGSGKGKNLSESEKDRTIHADGAVIEMFSECPEKGADPKPAAAFSLMTVWNSVGYWDAPMRKRIYGDIAELSEAVRRGDRKIMNLYNPSAREFGRNKDDREYRLMIGAAVLSTVEGLEKNFGSALNRHNHSVREYYKNEYLAAIRDFTESYQLYFHTTPVTGITPDAGKPAELFEGMRKFNRQFFGGFTGLARKRAGLEGHEADAAEETVLRAVLDGVNPVRAGQAYASLKQNEGVNISYTLTERRTKNDQGRSEGFPFSKGLGISFETSSESIALALAHVAEKTPEGVDADMTDRIACAALAGLIPEAYALFMRGQTTDASSLYEKSKELGVLLDRHLDGTVLERMSEKGIAFDIKGLRKEIGEGKADTVMTLDGLYPSLSSGDTYSLGPRGANTPSGLRPIFRNSESSSAPIPVPNRSEAAEGFGELLIKDYRSPLPGLFAKASEMDRSIRQEKHGAVEAIMDRLFPSGSHEKASKER